MCSKCWQVNLPYFEVIFKSICVQSMVCLCCTKCKVVYLFSSDNTRGVFIYSEKKSLLLPCVDVLMKIHFRIVSEPCFVTTYWCAIHYMNWR